ncbi:MAG: glycosyltransferase family 4 protein [Anaerolineae bacterium]|nr:glycosyltransferase family 4 protein [Anaerolineae bacterium]
MDVVMVGPFGLRPRGTMSARALPMAKALAARGHRIRLLLPPWQNPEDASRRWEEGGVTVENIALPPPAPGLFHLLTAARLTRRALALRPDVVHLFKPKAYSGLTHWLLARLPRTRRPRLVVDTDDWEGAGGWNEIGGYTPAQRRFFAWQERWGLTHADAVTVASRTLESLVWALGVPPQRVWYVPNGVSASDVGAPSASHPTPLPEPPIPRAVLLYTRFFEFPPSRVIEIVLRVRELIPETRLLIVGKGLFGEEEELLAMAAQAGLTVHRGAAAADPADVLYAGWVPAGALPEYFAQAAVAIYPLDDTLVNRAKCPAKLVDLLARGVPVVAEAVGQASEYIRHGETGWLVEPGNTASFAEAVARLLRDERLRTQLGGAAAEDMRERFSWERLVFSVEQAYGWRSP